jgi:hypothetical protein
MAVLSLMVIACGKVAPKSGLVALRYRIYQLVSTLSMADFVDRVTGDVLRTVGIEEL